MADTELVIKIPEHCLEELRHIELNESNEGVAFHAIKCIVNGTPLPKGHGDLIDRSDLLEYTDISRSAYTPTISRYNIITAPTIIEADKE